MNLKIKKIKLENFKGIKNKEIEFSDGNITTISGKNGSGKTTIMQAITFILFGCDTFGNKVDNEPLDKNGVVVKNYDQYLELTMLVDDKEYVLRKRIQRKSNSNNSTITELSINDVVFKTLKEFNDELYNIIKLDKELFLTLSNPKYLNSIANKNARSIILNNVKEVNVDSLLNQLKEDYPNKDWNMIIELLNKYNFNFDRLYETQSGIVSKMKAKLASDIEVKDQLSKVNLLENENDGSVIDFDKLEKEREDLIKELEQAGENKEYWAARNEWDKKVGRHFEVKREISDIKSEIHTVESVIKNFEHYTDIYTKQFEELAIKPVELICPVCNQDVPDKEQVTINKNKELDAIEEELRKSKNTVDHYNNCMIDWKEKLDIAEKEEKELMSLIKPLEKQWGKFYLSFRDIEEKIGNVNKILRKKDGIESVNNKLKEIQEKIDTQTKECVFEEDTLQNIEELLRLKAMRQEDEINKSFDNISVKLFEVKKNGNVKNVFTLESDGVPFSQLNNAAQTNGGIELINFLQKELESYVPILIDNSESINKIKESNTQLIKLLVTNKELKVEGK